MDQIQIEIKPMDMNTNSFFPRIQIHQGVSEVTNIRYECILIDNIVYIQF